MIEPHFHDASRVWYVTPERFRQIRLDALEDEISGRDPGLRYLKSFGPGAVTIEVLWPEQDPTNCSEPK